MKKTTLFAAILLAPALAFADDQVGGDKKMDDKGEKHEQIERSTKKAKESAKEQKAMHSKDGKENWHNMQQGKSEMKAGGDAKDPATGREGAAYGNTGGTEKAAAGSTTTGMNDGAGMKKDHSGMKKDNAGMKKDHPGMQDGMNKDATTGAMGDKDQPVSK